MFKRIGKVGYFSFSKAFPLFFPDPDLPKKDTQAIRMRDTQF